MNHDYVRGFAMGVVMDMLLTLNSLGVFPGLGEEATKKRLTSMRESALGRKLVEKSFGKRRHRRGWCSL